MSDRMTPIPFSRLMTWILEEKKKEGTVFGIHKPFIGEPSKTLSLFGGKLETPLGPAAGPHTQLAQNIVAAYYAGARFFELKTVQKLDGEDLPVEKPCIRAEDECYNVEWSTELYVPQALEEYVKAWFAIQVISREFGLGSPEGFQFNMSVGYDLKGIQLKKIDDFIEGLKDGTKTSVYQECMAWLEEQEGLFSVFKKEDRQRIPAQICNSVTLSTLHGCPPREIERIASYLMKEKGLHTFIKCNPTLLGYEFARKTLDDMGYDYIVFDDFHFKDDLQYEDAVPMLKRLMALAEEKGLSFGVKITNTFPVDIACNELPGKEMYMSGKSLYPLSISLAAKLSEEFGGKLRISYSGGADYYNIDGIFGAGIWPVTVATTLLKPGGYQRLSQMAEKLSNMDYQEFTGVDSQKARELSQAAKDDKHHKKAIKPLPSRKMKEKVPLLSCFTAPCKAGCPIHQDITAYMKEAKEGNYTKALSIITEKNPLPFITGTICAHNCMNQCTRNFYEESVRIRDMKLLAAKGGYEEFMKTRKKTEKNKGKKTAVVGGGPAGIAAAFFLAREGVEVTLFEKRNSLGGVVRHIIPPFRIPSQAIDRDVALMEALGVEVRLHTKVESLEQLKAERFDSIILAVGAGKPGSLRLEQGEAVHALTFLEEFKKKEGHLNLGRHVVVIGGGNTAMDCARAAKRTDGAEHVSLVYRRTKRYMPADQEELLLALEDGVEFRELLAPLKHTAHHLVCKKVVLGKPDASGRRSPVETEETIEIPADTVIAATGEKVDGEWYRKNGIALDEKGKAQVDKKTLETSVSGVYAVGDGLNGPATVVEAIRDAKLAAEAILGNAIGEEKEAKADPAGIYEKKGILKEPVPQEPDAVRCLTCSRVCENCVEVCPNRANVSIQVPGMEKTQIIHVDFMCNECGNCKSFCPYDSAPYQEKFTLFANQEDFSNSKNQGFVVLEKGTYLVRLSGWEATVKESEHQERVPEDIMKLMGTVCRDYPYLVY